MPGKIKIFEVPVGVGKTHLASKIELPEKCTIVTKTHKAGLYYTNGVRFPEHSEDMKKILQPYYDLGLSPWSHIKKKHLPGFEEYQRRKKAAKEAAIKIMTQARFFQDGELDIGNLLLFDECPLPWLLQPFSINLSVIEAIISRLDNSNSDLATLLRMLQKLDRNHVIAIDQNNNKSDYAALQNAVKRIGIGFFRGAGNVMSLLKATRITSDGNYLHYIVRRELRPTVDSIILSATPDISTYQRLFGDRVEVHSSPAIKPVARMHQRCDLSYSKSSLETVKRQDDFAAIVQNKFVQENFKVISLKDMEEQFSGLISGHFGALESIRDFEQENLIVIGTPNIPEPLLRLKASILDYPVETIDSYNDVDMSLTNFRGMEFYYKILSTDERIKNLQLHFTWEHLIQAVGRARYYGIDCLVILLSNFPLVEFEHVEKSMNNEEFIEFLKKLVLDESEEMPVMRA
ncbi:MAG: hypothetical protein ACOY5B_18795 [Spirochaetota bacterium]